jgi:hypothetical protein
MLVIDACIQPGTDRTDALIAWDRGMRRRQAAGDDGHALPPQSAPHGLAAYRLEGRRGHRRH